MYCKALSAIEAAQLGVNMIVGLSANDLTQATANTAQSFNAFAIPTGAFIDKVELRLITPFKDPADAAFNSTTVDVGDTGSATRFLTAQQVNENGTEITAPVLGSAYTTAYAASQFFTVNFNSMAAKSLVNIKVGELQILVMLRNYKLAHDAQPTTAQTK